MPSILEEFAYGNVSPEAQFYDKDSKYGRAMELTSKLEEKLLDRLEAEDKDLFQKYASVQNEANRLTAVENLVYGFKLGLTMTAETFLGMDGLYLGGEEL